MLKLANSKETLVKKQNSEGFSAVVVLIILVIIGLVSAVGWLVYDRQNNKQATNNTQETVMPAHDVAKPRVLAKGTFGDAGEYGSFEAEGYTSISKLDEAFCEENCKKYDYVFFTITRTENTNIFKYINSISGNSFVQDKSIGMGCVVDGQIKYTNSSDANGMKEYAVSKDDTSAILASAANKIVVLGFERLQFSSGGGAPTCYSHFTTIKLVK